MYFLFHSSFYLLQTLPLSSCCWLCNNSLVIKKTDLDGQEGKRVFGTWFAYSAIYLLCQNDLDLFQQIRASILHIRLTCDYSTGSPSTKSHWVPSSHLTLETELTCKGLIRGRGAGAGAFLKFKSKNAQCNAMSAKTCFAYSLSFKLCIYSSSGDYEHGWIWRSAYECHFWTNYKGT